MDSLEKYDSIVLSNWRKCDLLPLSLLLYYHTEHLTKCKNITNITTLRAENYVYCKSLIFSKNVICWSEYRPEKKLLPRLILFGKFCCPYEARSDVLVSLFGTAHNPPLFLTRNYVNWLNY